MVECMKADPPPAFLEHRPERTVGHLGHRLDRRLHRDPQAKQQDDRVERTPLYRRVVPPGEQRVSLFLDLGQELWRIGRIDQRLFMQQAPGRLLLGGQGASLVRGHRGHYADAQAEDRMRDGLQEA